LPRRVVVVAVAALITASIAAFVLRPETGVPSDAPTLDEMADAVGAPVMEHVRRGHVAGRSGEIMLIPKPHRYIIGEWDLTAFGTDDVELYTSHPNPWRYLTSVPLMLYGPEYVKEGVQIDRAVDISTLAPTYANILGMNDFTADGEPLSDALVEAGRSRPRVIFTVVIDGGGWNALQEHPGAHPTIDAIADGGVSYVNATLGSAPSITGALHATFGTGYYPLSTGIPGNQMRGSGGDPTIDTYLDNADPRFLKKPAVSELWDERNGNKPIVGTVSYEGWHLGMIGHGAQRPGGDEDIGVLWITKDNTWWVNEDYYELPDYLLPTELDRLETYEEGLDERDGIADGKWFGHTLDEIQEDVIRPGTPAFVRFTGDAVMEILRREGVGRDGMTDMFWVEIKPPDYGGHNWNVARSEQGDTILETDRQIARFKRYLDTVAGRGNYVLAISADHGQQLLPEETGGWRINSSELQRDLGERFGDDIVQKVTPVEIFIDRKALDEAGAELEDLARYIGAYTIEENIPDGAPGSDRVPQYRLDERLFAGAFPTGYIASLTPEDTARFGDSDYPEGRFLLSGDS
jgi:hypothetical protein